MPADLALETRCLVCGRSRSGREMLPYRQEAHDGAAHVTCLPTELAAALAATVFVYEWLCYFMSSLPESKKEAFACKARLIVAMAKYEGIAGSLRWVDSPLSEVKVALAKMQEHQERPEGWPFGEFWLLPDD